VFLVASALFSLGSVILEWFYPLLGLGLVLAAIMVAHIRWQTRSGRILQQLLTGANRIIARRSTLDTLIPEVQDAVSNLLGYPRSALYSWEADSLTLELLTPGLNVPTSAMAPLAQAAIDSRRPATRGHLLAVPLVYQDHVVGALVVAASGRATPARMVLLHLFAEQVAPALVMARLNTLQLRQRDLLQAILSSTPDPVLVVNQEGQIVRTNPAAVALFDTDVSRRDVIGFLIEQTGGQEINRSGLLPLAESLRRDQPFNREFSINKRRFSLVGAPLRAVEAGWVLLLHDITALKNLDELRSRMLRMASHDLKNPLSVIKGYAELLLEDELSAGHHKMLSHILTSSNRMFHLITELLDSDRVRLGTLELVRLDFNAAVAQITQEFHAQIEDKRLTLTFTPATRDTWVMGDAPQLREAVGNLISNAIKYTPPGGKITVTLVAYMRKVQLCVADTGIGIPKEAQPNLFTPYYRVRSEATAHITGTGLGLSIVRDVVESHGGRIWVESAPGQGSAFYLELPLAMTEAEHEPPHLTPTNAGAE
jgi:two-component system phosphate regulon sensor histidine kinase PhoR